MTIVTKDVTVMTTWASQKRYIVHDLEEFDGDFYQIEIGEVEVRSTIGPDYCVESNVEI